MSEKPQNPNKAVPGATYEVTPMGSLGLLAIGDVGLRAWREAREKAGWKPGQSRPDVGPEDNSKEETE